MNQWDKDMQASRLVWTGTALTAFCTAIDIAAYMPINPFLVIFVGLGISTLIGLYIQNN